MCLYRNLETETNYFLENFDLEQGKISRKDVGDCQCPEILAWVYSVLLEHAAASGRR